MTVTNTTTIDPADRKLYKLITCVGDSGNGKIEAGSTTGSAHRSAYDTGGHMRFVHACVVYLSSTALALTVDAAYVDFPDSGFETPNLGTGTDAYAYSRSYPTGHSPMLSTQPPLEFNGSAGIAANGSAFNVFGANNSNRSDGQISSAGQCAFLQSYHGSDSNIVDYINVSDDAAGNATLSFAQEPRAQGDELLIVVDSTTLLAPDIPYLGENFQSPPIQRDLGYLPPGLHSITFLAVRSDPSLDLATFIDDPLITTTPVPEPATSLAAVLFAAYCGRARRRSSRQM